MSPIDLFSIGSWAIYDHLFKLAKYPHDGDTVTLDMPVENLDKFYFGDCSANIAAAAGRLGVRAGLGMVVGDDFASSGYEDHLRSLGVDLRGVEVRQGQSSGHNYIYFDGAGSGFCISHLGVAEEQGDWLAPVDLIHEAKMVVISEKFSSYTLAAARAAHAAGKTVVLNGMVATSGDLAPAFLELAEILFISHSEMDDLLSLCRLNDPRELLYHGFRLIFATQGEKGSCVYSSAGVQEVPIVPAERFVDSTGAGDSYAAGALAGLLNGLSPLKAAQIGATVSSFVVEEWGCQTNLPTWNQTMERYHNHFE